VLDWTARTVVVVATRIGATNCCFTSSYTDLGQWSDTTTKAAFTSVSASGVVQGIISALGGPLLCE
jgi:hypothetical protein